MKRTVTIIDYGRAGNISSVMNAFKHCGAEIRLTSDPDEIRSSDLLVLPGDGAFKDCMTSLKGLNLVEPTKEFIQSGKPFFGICVGMQMLFTSSEEFGASEGLDIIQGEVRRIPEVGSTGKVHKIPHISWEALYPSLGKTWENTSLKDVNSGEFVYFVHSFAGYPKDENHLLGHCLYNGVSIAGVVAKDNVFGCQFHPEKSGPTGLKIISSFIHQ